MEPIAIVGFAFRFPQGAEDEASFWDMLQDGRNVMTEWPKERGNIDAFSRGQGQSTVKNRLSSRGAHFLQGDPSAFDAPFFSITAKEAASMDPQQRWMLETTYRALEKAGIAVEKVAGSDAAVFTASMADDYAKLNYKDPDEAPMNTATGTSPSFLANRLSWYFDLKGPSVQLNTACSSSMIATDLACQCLRSGQCSMALVAGSNTILTPEESLHLENLNLLSLDGRSYSFDSRASGYGRGEGVAVIVLKKLDDAIRNGDMIRGVIRASGSNQDGHTPSITQPSLTSQEDLIRKVYKMCSLDLSLTRYVEAHGTGTMLGDQTEAKSLGQVFRAARSVKEPLYIGSVKANIGHLEGLSGLAGILKAVMILEKGVIPPNPLFEKWNPKINAKFYNLKVPTSCTPWPTAGLRRISVNSFGFGGSNGHIILDDAFHTLETLGSHVLVYAPISLPIRDSEHPQRIGRKPLRLQNTSDPNSSEGGNTSPRYRLLIWSAKDEAALKRMMHGYNQYCEEHVGSVDNLMENLAYTLAARRSVMPWKAFAVVGDQLSSGTIDSSLSKPMRSLREPGLAFVFTGQGAQYARMGLDLLVYPVFHDVLSRADAIFHTLGADWSIFDELKDAKRIHSPQMSQPLCTVLQIALVDLLRHFGVVPDAVVGHSSGEIAAAYTAGALSLESACRVAYHRGRLAQKLVASSSTKPGAMMSVNIPAAEIDGYLDKLRLSADISVACVNSPVNVTVSGDEVAIDELQIHLNKAEIFARKLETGVAYHSSAMQQISEEYLSSLGSLKPRAGSHNILMVSSVTGLRVPAAALKEGQYWADNLVSTVQFVDALQYLAAAAPKVDGLKALSTYVEIGPHGALKRAVGDTLSSVNRGRTFSYLPALSRFDSPVKTMLELVGGLFSHGHAVSVVDSNQYGADLERRSFLVDTPEYPFDRSQVHWHESRLSRDWRFREAVPLSLLGVPVTDWNPLEPKWRKFLRMEEISWLKDHVIGDDVLFPATASICVALEAVKRMAISRQAIAGYRVEEATFMKPIVIRAENGTEMITQLRLIQKSYETSASRFEVRLFTVMDGYWSECVNSIIRVEQKEPRNEVDNYYTAPMVSRTFLWDHDQAKEKTATQISKSKFYKWLGQQGLKYGDAFSLADEICWYGDQFTLGRVNIEPATEPYQEVFHPAIFDAACQLCYVAPSDGMSSNKLGTTIPHRIRDMWISDEGWQCPDTRFIRVLTKSKLKHAGAGIECSMEIRSDNGSLLGHIEKFDMAPIMTSISRDMGPTNKLLHRIDWKPCLSLLETDQIPPYCGTEDTGNDRTPIGRDLGDLDNALRLLFYHKMGDALRIEWANAPPHMNKYIAYLKDELEASSGEPTERGTEATMRHKLEELSASNPSWKLFLEISQNLLPIVRGDVDASDLLLSTPIAQNFYEDLLRHFFDDKIISRFRSFLDLAVHQRPGLRILEIGAGSGAMSNLILTILEQIERSTGAVAFSEYVCTDLAELNLQKVRERFPKYQSRMSFKPLDLQQGMLSRVFHPGDFDIILAGGSLHSTRCLPSMLTDAHHVLRQGGHLIICEATSQHRFAFTFGLGVLPEWWRTSEPDSPASQRIYSESEWDAALRQNGFSGNDLIIRDNEDRDGNQASIIISHANNDAVQELGVSARVLLIVRGEKQYQEDLAKSLAENVFTMPGYQSLIVSLAQLPDMEVNSGDYILFLADLGLSLLTDISEPSFTLVKSLVERSANLLWISDGDTMPFSGIKDGLLRTLRAEFNSKRIISLSLDDATQGDINIYIPQISKVFLSAFKGSTPTELEYILRDGRLHIGRLVADARLNHELSSSIRPEITTSPWLPGPPLKLDLGSPGKIDSLYFREDDMYYEDIGPTEVEIEARAWALNFRDVLSALGRLEDPGFGSDCAGIVTRVGQQCDTIKVGDRVGMNVIDSMRMYPRADEQAVVKIDPSMSFEEACALINPAMTAWYSLVEVARLGRGEKLLVHSASGATGQLAIQIAQRAGAEVFATVGYENKKQLLMDQYGIPADHIFYSRSNNATFTDGIMKITNGYGVDVVLNSLAGESLRASWKCIAPYGRFVELGKADINANSNLSMAQFAHNATFAAVDIYHMLSHAKRRATELLQKVMALASDGSIRHPKPLNIYTVAAVEDAFRYFQSGKSSGRVIIRIEQSIKVPKHLITRKTWRFDGYASYLVVGGLGGVGRAILKWMAGKGAKHLIVPSRSGIASDAATKTVEELRGQGLTVITPSCDVASRDSITGALEEWGKTMPPIKGCINAAMVLNDVVFENMSHAQWDRTIRSKVSTSWNLHSILDDLDFMVFISSVSGIVGNPGQSNYAAGCAFQDALARYRTHRGQKTTSIDLGVMRTIGVVAESESLQKHFDGGARGLGQIEVDEFLALLDICCDPATDPTTHQNRSQIIMGLSTPVDFFSQSLDPPEILNRPLFAHFSQAFSSSSGGLGNGRSAEDNHTLRFQQAETAEERSSVVVEWLTGKLARSLAIKPDDIEVEKPLHAYGVDSLGAVELRNWIAKEFAADVPVYELAGGRSVEGVGSFVEKSSQIRKGA